MEITDSDTQAQRNLENVQRSSVLLPAPSPALPAAMADDPKKSCHLALEYRLPPTARATHTTQLVDIVR